MRPEWTVGPVYDMETGQLIGFTGDPGDWIDYQQMRPKVSSKVKQYPDNNRRVTVCNTNIFAEPVEWLDRVPLWSKPKDMTNEVRKDNMKRSKENIFDIAYLNPFQYFVTWTLDKEKIDRYDPLEVGKKVRKKLNNMVTRGKLDLYLIIPEHHQDGAIHMHGLLSGNFDLVSSDLFTNSGQPIYNMPDWPYGWSTAIEIYGDQQDLAAYMTKYITKDLKKIFGSFYYAGGHGLIRKPAVVYEDLDYGSLEVPEHYESRSRLSFKYLQTTVRIHDAPGMPLSERDDTAFEQSSLSDSRSAGLFGDDHGVYSFGDFIADIQGLESLAS